MEQKKDSTAMGILLKSKAAERKRKSRAAMSEAKKQSIKAIDAENRFKSRATMSVDKKENILQRRRDLWGEKKAEEVKKIGKIKDTFKKPNKSYLASSREAMAKYRSTLSNEAKQDAAAVAREGMAKYRSTLTNEAKEEAKAVARERTVNYRLTFTNEENNFERIVARHKMRKMRKYQSGKDHLFGNLRAKKGMRVLREEGRLKDIGWRFRGAKDEIREWESFMEKDAASVSVLEMRKPKLVEFLNSKHRKEKEDQEEKERCRAEIVKDNGGEWCYNAEYSEWYWSGEGDRPCMNDGCGELTTEELEEEKRQEEELQRRVIEDQRLQVKEKQRQKNLQIKEAMKKPIEPMPKQETCAYEMIREQIIKEREEAMEACGFFKVLEEYKKTIGIDTKTNK